MGFASEAGKKGDGGSTKQNGGNGKKGTQNRCPPWKVTKKGNTITQDGKKYVWCPHHTSKDRTINGLYMAFPHDHDAWVVKKKDRTKHYREKRDREGKSPDATKGSAKKPKPNDNKLKLALSDKLTSALVTQYHLSQAEADALFKTAYTKAQEN